MKTVLIHVHVKPEQIEAFREATLDNARNSRLEPGIVRFEVYQQADDPAHFVLLEIFRDAEGQSAHRATAHYQRWRDTVAGMMTEPRRGLNYVAVV